MSVGEASLGEVSIGEANFLVTPQAKATQRTFTLGPLTNGVDFWIKENDTSPSLQVQLKDRSGTLIDISGASVDFEMQPVNGSSLKIDNDAVIVDQTDGTVKYNWQPGDTDTTGRFEAQFEINFADGTSQTYPGEDYILIEILSDFS